MKKIHGFMKIVSLLLVTVMLFGVTGVMAQGESEGVISVTNGTAYADFTSAWDGSLLIAATVNKEEGASASVRLVAADGSTLANIPVDAALDNGTDTAIHLVVSKNNGTYKLYKGSTVVTKGTIDKTPAKSAVKIGFTAKDGTINVSKVSIFDYMEKRNMTDVLFTNDFTALSSGTRIGTSKVFNGYCDDWYLENPWAGNENGWDYALNGETKEYYASQTDGTNGLKYIDRTGNQSIRHMIKKSGMKESFEISALINFPGGNNYTGGFRLFLTNAAGEEINLIKSPASINGGSAGYRVSLTDNTGTSLFGENTLPTYNDVTFTVNVDLDAQMYQVSCTYGTTTRTSSALKLPVNIDSVVSYGYAKDKIATPEDYGLFYIKNAAVKACPEVGVTELFSEDFNDGITGWNNVGGNQYSKLEINSVNYEGHKAMLVERKWANNISPVTNKTAGVTHYGTLNADDTFTADSGAASNEILGSGVGASKAHSACYTLPTPISTEQDLYVEFDARLGNKSWKWNGTSYEAPRDVAYVCLGNSTTGLGEPEYMDYMYSSGAIQSFGGAKSYAATGELLMPETYYNWKSNGPSAEWVTSNINNDGSNHITYKTVGSVEGKERAITYTKSGVNSSTFNTITISVNRNNGGAFYIDNIRIYTKDKNAVETINFSQNVMSQLVSNPSFYGNEFAIGNIATLGSGAPMESISVYNYSGDTTKDVCVIAALYENDGSYLSLIDCASDSITLNNIGANTATFDDPIITPDDFTSGNYTLKVFLFEGFTNLIPLQRPMEYFAQ